MFTRKWWDRRGHDSWLLLESTALQLPGIVANKEDRSQGSIAEERIMQCQGVPCIMGWELQASFLDIFSPVTEVIQAPGIVYMSIFLTVV